MIKKYAYMVVGEHNCLIEYANSDLTITVQGIVTIKGTMIDGSGPVFDGKTLMGREMLCKTHLNNVMIIEMEE